MRTLSAGLPADAVLNVITPSSLFVVSLPVSRRIFATVVSFHNPLIFKRNSSAPVRAALPVREV